MTSNNPHCEFTCPSWAAFNSSSLSPTDVQVDSHHSPSLITITLRQSKTDVFGDGVSICLGRTNNSLCPVAAVLAYLAVRPPSSGPLFLLDSRAPLSCQFLVTQVRQALASTGMAVTNFNGHSFRIAATTTASLAGIPDSTIQRVGCWRSSAFFTRYITPPAERLTSISLTLSLES